MSKFFLLIVVVLFSASSIAATEAYSIVKDTDITAYKAHSITHTNSNVRNVHLIRVTGLSAGCKSLYYNAANDPFLHSAVISGVLKREKNIKLYYHTDSSTRWPWGDAASCQLTSFTVNFL